MQSIAALAGTGEAASAEYVRQRERIEGRHGPNDDGTLTHWQREHGDRSVYDEHPDPITEASPVAAMKEFGLIQRDVNQLEKHDCNTLADMRTALANGDIETWKMCGPVMASRVRAVIEAVDA